MPIFAILAHTHPAQVARLVESLRPYPVVLHVDLKQDPAPFSGLEGVNYVTDRIDVNWGGFSVVRATLKLFEVALTLADAPENVIVLTGQCYPVKPIESLERYLESVDWRQCADGALVFDGSSFSERRLRSQWLFDRIPVNRGHPTQKLRGLSRRTSAAILPRRAESTFAPYTPVAGSQFISLTTDFLEDLLPVAQSPGYQSLFEHALAPDEIFFHTLVHSFPHWSQQNRHAARRTRNGKAHGEFAAFHRVAQRASSIPESDWEDPRVFFIRKVDPAVDAHLLDRIDVKCGRIDPPRFRAQKDAVEEGCHHNNSGDA